MNPRIDLSFSRAAFGWVLALAGLTACTPEPTEPTNILLVSIDSLRPDHLGSYGYFRDTSPTIDSLAAGGVLFETALSTSSWTLPSHAALFTGLPDRVHGAFADGRWLDESRETVAEAFRAAGYETVGLYSGPYLHPSWGLAQGFESWIDCTSYSKLTAERNAEHGDLVGSHGGLAKAFHRLSHRDVTNPILEKELAGWLGRRETRPFFLFLHLWDVHYDYIPPKRFVERFDPDYQGSLNGEIRSIRRRPASWTARDVSHLIARYDGEIAWTDETLGRMLGLLEASGLLQNTAIVVTADHGEAFFEHGQLTHRQTLYDEEIKIPLVIRHPQKIPDGLRIDEQVRIIDIAPTLLDLAALPPLENTGGRSLMPLVDGTKEERPRDAVAELRDENPGQLTLRSQHRKWYWDRRRSSVRSFDLEADPEERKPEAPADPTEVEALYQATSAKMRQLETRLPSIQESARPSFDPTTVEQLRRLGYVE